MSDETLGLAGSTTHRARSASFDTVTVASMSLIAYVLSSLLHEGLGHGGACLLVGGRPTLLTSSSFNMDSSTMTDTAQRIVFAGGTVVNLGVGLVGGALLRRTRPRSAWGFFLWLFTAVSAFQGAGYLLASPLGGFGDWMNATSELPAQLPIRLGLTALGALLTWRCLRFFGTELGAFVDATAPEERKAEARWLLRVAYIAGGTTILIEALYQSPLFVFTSALAVLGGTGPMLALPVFVPPASPIPRSAIPRASSKAWLVGALVIVIPFAAIFGRGVHITPAGGAVPPSTTVPSR